MKRKLGFDNTLKFGLLCGLKVPDEFELKDFNTDLLDEFLAAKDIKFGKKSPELIAAEKVPNFPTAFVNLLVSIEESEDLRHEEDE